jgi:hypothetical protein
MAVSQNGNTSELPLEANFPKVGQIVQVRTRTYLVDDVVRAPETVFSTMVRLICVDDDAQGQTLEVIWELELEKKIIDREAWKSIGTKGFDSPKLFGAYVRTLRWNCVTATDPRLFQSPFRAGIRIDAYQLEPLRKALVLPRVNLLIADDVGLGKTIEAGLIASELLLRRRAREIVIACPPSCCSNGRRRWNRASVSSSKSWIEITSKESARNADMESTLGRLIQGFLFLRSCSSARRTPLHFARGSTILDLPACSFSMRLIMRLRLAVQSTPLIPRSQKLYAISLHGSNIAFSFLLLLTTGTRTASVRCWNCWILSVSREGLRW